jgi:hypothetical protein
MSRQNIIRASTDPELYTDCRRAGVVASKSGRCCRSPRKRLSNLPPPEGHSHLQAQCSPVPWTSTACIRRNVLTFANKTNRGASALARTCADAQLSR